MASQPQPDNLFGVDHTILNGMYQRRFWIKKDTVVVSRVHKFDYLFIVAKGVVLINDTAIMDESALRYEAGDCFTAKAGAKRAVFALENSVIISVHRTDKHNLEKIERELIVPNPMDLYDVHDKPKQNTLTADHDLLGVLQ